MNKRYYNIVCWIFIFGWIITDWILPNWNIHIKLEFIIVITALLAAFEWFGMPLAILPRYRGTQIAREYQKENAKYLALFAVAVAMIKLIRYLSPTYMVENICLVIIFILLVISAIKIHRVEKKYSELMKAEPEEKETSR